jgi:hypothetical protein|tara:strand:- start:215 stop:607 length:393 start_codon:yes stop_codon:yes gene_type:complete
MKIAKSQLRRIIRESLNEALPPHLQKHFRDDGSSVHAPEWKDVTPAGYGPDQDPTEIQLVFDAVGLTPDEGIEVQNALEGTGPEWMGTSSYEKLFDYYAFETGDMPPGIASARDGDPDYWILDQLEGLGT